MAYPASGIGFVTPPVGPLPDVISNVSISGGNIVIGFRPTDANATYKLARSTNLVNWTVLPDAPVVAGGNVTFTVPLSGEDSFYRIVK